MDNKSGVPTGASRPPASGKVAHLQATVLTGLLHSGITVVLFATGIGLSVPDNLPAWLLGQVILALGFVQAFVLMHEAGHYTLFPSRRVNRIVGHLAGFLTVLPFWNWQRIHARHHHYTGWQDLDATTASLVPRPIAAWERLVINLAWATWLPLFALAYRVQNFWNLPRVERYITNPKSRRRIRINTLVVGIAYGLTLAWVGPLELFWLAGPGFLLSLVIQEALILSQHTHVPQRLSDGQPVRAFPLPEQELFTRSLRLPGWLSFLLMHFDAHELHHIYPHVPGYQLRHIQYRPAHEVHWWRWIRAARGLRGTGSSATTSGSAA